MQEIRNVRRAITDYIKLKQRGAARKLSLQKSVMETLGPRAARFYRTADWKDWMDSAARDIFSDLAGPEDDFEDIMLTESSGTRSNAPSAKSSHLGDRNSRAEDGSDSDFDSRSDGSDETSQARSARPPAKHRGGTGKRNNGTSRMIRRTDVVLSSSRRQARARALSQDDDSDSSATDEADEELSIRRRGRSRNRQVAGKTEHSKRGQAKEVPRNGADNDWDDSNDDEESLPTRKPRHRAKNAESKRSAGSRGDRHRSRNTQSKSRKGANLAADSDSDSDGNIRGRSRQSVKSRNPKTRKARSFKEALAEEQAEASQRLSVRYGTGRSFARVAMN